MRPAILYLGAVLVSASVLPATAAAPPGAGTGAPALFSADEVQYDEDLGLVVAKGNVEISQNDQILLADTVTYNQRTDTMTASGHVSLLQPSGDVVFADFAELDNNMRDGFLKNLRMLLADRSRLAANTARRSGGIRTELRRGVYSPCEPCREDPTRPPLWQIEASEIVSDKELQIIEYRNATMEIAGFPIFYAPYFSHADPSVRRRSGFLAPSVGNSNTNGFHFTIPYFWVIDNDKDMTITPLFTTRAGYFIGDQYRQRFGNGQIETNGSVTFDSKHSTAIDTTPVSGVRGHIFADGVLDLNEDWRTVLSLQRASDPTYLLRYHLNSPPNFLTTHLYGEGFGPTSYTNVSGWGFQSLRAGIGDSQEPIVAPIADYVWQSQPDVLGGRVAVEGNALNLMRIQGIDMRRLSFGPEWRLPFNGPIGERYNLSLSTRGDGYYSEDLPIAASTTATQNAFAGRGFPQFALTMEYPWVRRDEGFSEVIEPVVMGAAAPNGGNPGTIPNEDSQGFEFDETSLFRRNRFPGFDRVDSGQRVDYGIRAGVYADGGGSARMIVGQSYSAQVNDNFGPGSGLEHHFSDVVGRVTITPAPYLDLTYRYRLDHSTLTLRRQEAVVSGGPTNLRVSGSFLQIAAIPDVVPALPERKQIALAVSTQLTRYWSLQAQTVRDLKPSVPISATGVPLTNVGQAETLSSGAAITYRDECLAVVGSVTQSGIVFGDVRPGVSFVLSLVFKNLGDISF